MIFEATRIDGAYVLKMTEHADERGSFGRAYCQRTFAEHGLEPVMVQGNVSLNHKAGTLRGMHYQVAPSEEAKLVRCTRGSIVDVIVDLRPGSPTYLEHLAVELSASNRHALYVPPMCAHGFLTLEDDTEVSYLVSGFYDPGAERGVRYDDETFGIHWPRPVTVISPKDASWPTFEPNAARAGHG
jgi:dTDP-4-dehydrorhamnose 3,5-epimerase